MALEDRSATTLTTAMPMMPHHGTKSRTEEAIPGGSRFTPGRFGRMFPDAPPLDVEDQRLVELAAALKEATPPGSLDNPDVPAGFTYLGQFVDHDITFDPTVIPEKVVDPQQVHNFRSPRLDLDCLYGMGPAVQPYLYEKDDRARLLLGRTAPSADQDGVAIPPSANDLPRNSEGFALIGDPRNDENLVVAQLHVAFLKFHNAVLAGLAASPLGAAERFVEARRLVTWHYQWIVVHEFLKAVLEPQVVDEVLRDGARHLRWREVAAEPFIPVEFSVAAYRFGHSMVRDFYDHNRVFGPGPARRLAPGSLALLFFFTGPTRTKDGLTSAPVPSNWAIDWRRFFRVRQAPASATLNLSRQIDSRLASELHRLHENHRVGDAPTSLAERNLLRGARVRLPSGQTLAAAMGVTALAPNEIRESTGDDGAIAARHGLHEQSPLWYYVLKEAQIRHGGRRLGPLGSRIVSEVFVALLQGDPHSFLAQAPGWTPTLRAATPGTFTMADLLELADANSPTINATEDPRVLV